MTENKINESKLQIKIDKTSKEPAFIVNDLIRIYNFENSEDKFQQMFYSLDYNEDVIREDEAIQLGDEAIKRIIELGIEKAKKDNE